MYLLLERVPSQEVILFYSVFYGFYPLGIPYHHLSVSIRRVVDNARAGPQIGVMRFYSQVATKLGQVQLGSWRNLTSVSQLPKYCSTAFSNVRPPLTIATLIGSYGFRIT